MRKRSDKERKAMFASMAEAGIGRLGPRKAREALLTAADRFDKAVYRVTVELENQPIDKEARSASAHRLKAALTELDRAEKHLKRTIQETTNIWTEEGQGEDGADESGYDYEEEPPVNDLERIREQNRNAERASAEVSEEWGPQPDRAYWLPDNINEILAGLPEKENGDLPKDSASSGSKGSRDKKALRRDPPVVEMTLVKKAPPRRLLEEWDEKLKANPYPLNLDPPLGLPDKFTDHKADIDFLSDYSPGGKKYREISKEQKELKRHLKKPPAYLVEEMKLQPKGASHEEVQLNPKSRLWSEGDRPAKVNHEHTPKTMEGLDQFAGEVASKLGFHLNDRQRKWVVEKAKSGGEALVRDLLTALKKAINKRKASAKDLSIKGRGSSPEPQARPRPVVITVRGKKITVPDFMVEVKVEFSTKPLEDFIEDKVRRLTK